MGTFIAAYLIVWTGVVWYVLRLGAAQRRLQRALDALKCESGRPGTREQTTVKAA